MKIYYLNSLNFQYFIIKKVKNNNFKLFKNLKIVNLNFFKDKKKLRLKTYFIFNYILKKHYINHLLVLSTYRIEMPKD